MTLSVCHVYLIYICILMHKVYQRLRTVINGSDIPFLASLMMVKARMRSSGCLSTGLQGHLVSKSLHQLSLLECTFPPLLFLLLSDRERERDKEELANPGSQEDGR